MVAVESTCFAPVVDFELRDVLFSFEQRQAFLVDLFQSQKHGWAAEEKPESD